MTKASALEEVAREVGAGGTSSGAVPVTVAFGDMPNDLEMLRWADHGVAMGNALPSLHTVADEVTLTNDEAYDLVIAVASGQLEEVSEIADVLP